MKGEGLAGEVLPGTGNREPGTCRPKAGLIAVVGPTASGKSALAMELAVRLGGEIVSADSVQVYRGLDVGSAKPGSAERTRVPHHMIDVADPDEAYHAGRYRDEARVAITGVLERGRVPILCGGTGLYVKAVLEGLAPAPPRDETVRAGLEAHWVAGGAADLWHELERADPPLAERLHPNDRTRVIRGLEVWRASGQRLSEYQNRHRFAERPYRVLFLGAEVDRDELYRRIDRRTVAMFEAGWVGEVEALLGQGYDAHLPALGSIGYRQIADALVHGVNPAGVVPGIQRETRRYAKRQLTWFGPMDVAWLDPNAPDAVAARCKKFLQRAGPGL